MDQDSRLIVGFAIRISGLTIIEFRVSGLTIIRGVDAQGPAFSPHCRHQERGLGVSGFGFRVSGFGFRVSGFGFRASNFGFRVSGFGFRVSYFVFRVGFRV